MVNRKVGFLVVGFLVMVGIGACDVPSVATLAPGTDLKPIVLVEIIDRETKIPTEAVKISSENDEHPPVLFSSEFAQPRAIPGDVNTAGAEDSPFITNDGNTLYFFFTPDVTVPVEKQILDGVTGIYAATKRDGSWGKPERIVLQDAGKLSGDGCEFVLDNLMYFCSVREGYTGIHWFTAEYRDGQWQAWHLADFNPEFEVGELHITDDGTELYFASERAGGRGNLDIWVSHKAGDGWQEPVNVAVVNSGDSEGWPALNPDGDELWFSRNDSIWRSKRLDGAWQEPELMVGPLAGEPTIDAAGNLYFVHHFYSNDEMIEADIYGATRK